MPAVSVIIPTHNCARYLPQAVQSVLDQTYRDFEIVVVDDGSTDETRECLEKYGSQIRYVYQSCQERSAARNRGIDLSSGKYLAFLDADDFLDPRFLEKQTSVLDSRPEVGLVHCWAWVTGPEGKPFRIEGRAPLALDHRAETFRRLLMRNWIQGMSVLLRRGCLGDTEAFDVRLSQAEDWDLFLRIARSFPLAEVREPLMYYRRHGDCIPARELERGMEQAYQRILGKYVEASELQGVDEEAREEACFWACWRISWAYYATGNVDAGKLWLDKAARLRPSHFLPPSEDLAREIGHWADALYEPCTTLEQSFEALNSFFGHLPGSVRGLEAMRRKAIGYTCGVNLFRNRKRGSWKEIRKAAPRAVRYRPGWLANRGFVSIWLKSLVPPLRGY